MHNLYLAFRLASEFRHRDRQDKPLETKYKILEAIKSSSLISKICEDYQLVQLDLNLPEKKKTFVLSRICILLTDLNTEVDSNPYMTPKNFWERYRLLNFLAESCGIQVAL